MEKHRVWGEERVLTEASPTPWNKPERRTRAPPTPRPIISVTAFSSCSSLLGPPSKSLQVDLLLLPQQLRPVFLCPFLEDKISSWLSSWDPNEAILGSNPGSSTYSVTLGEGVTRQSPPGRRGGLGGKRSVTAAFSLFFRPRPPFGLPPTPRAPRGSPDLVAGALSWPPTEDVGRGLAPCAAQGHLGLGEAAQCSPGARAMELAVQQAQHTHRPPRGAAACRDDKRGQVCAHGRRGALGLEAGDGGGGGGTGAPRSVVAPPQSSLPVVKVPGCRASSAPPAPGLPPRCECEAGSERGPP